MEQRFEVTALRDAICKAKAAADALSGTPDYGTYNFDTPVIELPDGYDISEFTTRESSEWNGFTLERIDSEEWQGYYWINGICKGMQMRRTEQAEAVAQCLNEQGYNAHVYYEMD